MNVKIRLVLVVTVMVFQLIAPVVSASTATVPEEVNLPDSRHINGVELRRNGHGIRSISFFGMDIQVYVAGFYTEKPLLSTEEVYSCHHHQDDTLMQLDFTFLRSVNKGRVISAWQKQLEHSVTFRYEGYEADRDLFIEKLSSPISYLGTQTVQIIGDNTVLVDQGVNKGIIPGKNFQIAFLSMWFGENAVAEDLKSDLLSGALHHEKTHTFK
jgi:hypothetical protein